MPAKLHPNVRRRDAMWDLLERFQNTPGQPIKEEVTALLKSITSDDLRKPPNHSNLSGYPVWETICVAAHISHLAGWGMPSERIIQNYLPTFNDAQFTQFKLSWEDIRKRNNTSVNDLLNLIRAPANFRMMVQPNLRD